MTDAASLARKLHGLIEPLHNVHYFATETREAFEQLGLQGFAQCYVAGRAAPMGTVGPKVATATFFNFNPSVMEQALPEAWEIASPRAVLEARAQAVEAMFARLGAPTEGLGETTALAREAVDAADLWGRPLAAGNADVPEPGTPFAALWQALTVLREHRGDGHIGLMVAEGLGPVDALVLHVAWEPRMEARFFQRSRRWDDEQWERAEQGLRERGWLDAEGGLTEEGHAFRDRLERDTDARAAAPFRALGTDGCRRLFDGLVPLFDALDASGAHPMPLRRPQPVGD